MWVSARNVNKGQRWKPNIADWDFEMDLNDCAIGNQASVSKVALPDTTVLGKTVVGLINEFLTNPATFMGTKLQDLLNKRNLQRKGSTVESIAKTIIHGIKDANVYVTLNKTSFTVMDVISAAKYRIDENFPHGTGGVYIRYHTSTSAVTRWLPDTKYIYVGKTIDYRDRFDGHPASKSSYGDLTRNSKQLLSSALCLMEEADNTDFAYLVEQIFVCLFESYRADLLIGPSGAVDAARGIEQVEAVQAALYFSKISNNVFSETRYPGAVNRSSFGVSEGANYSMPFKEWAVTMEQLLFLRHDTAIKCRATGSRIPITVFKRAKPKIANYSTKHSGTPAVHDEMCVFQKYNRGKFFFGVRHSQKIWDGTM